MCGWWCRRVSGSLLTWTPLDRDWLQGRAVVPLTNRERATRARFPFLAFPTYWSELCEDHDDNKIRYTSHATFFFLSSHQRNFPLHLHRRTQEQALPLQICNSWQAYRSEEQRVSFV